MQEGQQEFFIVLSLTIACHLCLQVMQIQWALYLLLPATLWGVLSLLASLSHSVATVGNKCASEFSGEVFCPVQYGQPYLLRRSGEVSNSCPFSQIHQNERFECGATSVGWMIFLGDQDFTNSGNLLAKDSTVKLS